MATGLVMMRTKDRTGEMAWQCAITQRARGLTRTVRHSSTASIVVLMNAAGASAAISPAAAKVVAEEGATLSPAAATAAAGVSATLSPAAQRQHGMVKEKLLRL